MFLKGPTCPTTSIYKLYRPWHLYQDFIVTENIMYLPQKFSLSSVHLPILHSVMQFLLSAACFQAEDLTLCRVCLLHHFLLDEHWPLLQLHLHYLQVSLQQHQYPFVPFFQESLVALLQYHLEEFRRID